MPEATFSAMLERGTLINHLVYVHITKMHVDGKLRK